MLYRGEVNIVLLDDTRIERVEVHDKNDFVPESTFWFEDETSFIFIFSILRSHHSGIVTLFRVYFDCSGSLFPPQFVGTDIFERMELVKKNVFVSFSATSIQRLVPSGTYVSGGRP